MRLPVVTWVLLVVGCGGSPEGTNPAECSDNIDNDNNGLVDQFDPGCASVEEVEGDASGECEDDQDNDGDELVDCDDPDCDGAEACDIADTEGEFVHQGLASVMISYSLTIKPRTLNDGEDDANPYCNPTFNLCDCTMTFAGDGAFESGAGEVGTFVGSFYLTSNEDSKGDPCNPSLLDALWYADQGDSVYHTFRWVDGGVTLEDWVVHADPDKSDPIPTGDTENGPKANQQYYILEMAQAYTEGAPGMTYAETGKVDDATQFVTTWTVQELRVQFQ